MGSPDIPQHTYLFHGDLWAGRLLRPGLDVARLEAML